MKIALFTICLFLLGQVLGQDGDHIQNTIKNMLDRIESLELKNKELETQNEEFRTKLFKSAGVQFAAYLDEGGDFGSTSGQSVISFNNILFNHGNAFDGTTFTAPVNGYYRFEFDAMRNMNRPDTYNAILVIVQRNEAEVKNFYDAGPGSGYYHHIHFAFQMYLAENDKVLVKLGYNYGLYAAPDKRIHFSGELLFIE